MQINGHHLNVIHRVVDANRATLVFLHDSLGCVQLWRDFPEKLVHATQCNLLIYDRLGYGQSDAMPTYERNSNYLELEAETLNEILETLSINNAILIGHSDGGSIALLAASLFPQNIKAVIVEAAHIFVEAVTLKGINEALIQYQTTSLKERLQKYHGDKVETLFNAWTKTWLHPNFQDWNIEACLPHITCPLLFLQGENDEYGSLRQVTTTLQLVSGPKQSEIIPNIGHTPHKEAPEYSMATMSQFINQL